MSHRTALIMLASGRSTRFGEENKLMTQFRGAPLAACATQLSINQSDSERFVVVPKGAQNLSLLFSSAGWQVSENPNPELGQSFSLKLGLQAALKHDPSAIVICLADMPFLSSGHLNKLVQALKIYDAVISKTEETLTPPAAFNKICFDDILALSGDRGAKSVFLNADRKATILLDDREAIDIDTKADLLRYECEVTVNA